MCFPNVPGKLMIGPKPGLTEAEVRAALKPHVGEILYYSEAMVEVSVAPFREPDEAKRIETALPDVVRYAEAVPMVRHVYSPGWFARQLLPTPK